VEPGIALPDSWPVLQRYRQQPGRWSFPFDVLQRTVLLLKQGTEIRAGFAVSREDPLFSDLTWPEPVRMLVAVDHDWDDRSRDEAALAENSSASDGNELSILSLCPVTGNVPKESLLLQFAEKKRADSWKKFMLPLPV
jgi:hypothetical protein